MFYTQPEIPEWHEFFWEAFSDLSTERQIGMGLGPIPRSAIMAYAAEHDLFGDAAENFAAIIRRVDVAYLRMSNAATDKKLSNEVSATDVEGSKQVMQRLSARAGSATKQHVKKGNGES